MRAICPAVSAGEKFFRHKHWVFGMCADEVIAVLENIPGTV
jgi:hypothetical protein